MTNTFEIRVEHHDKDANVLNVIWFEQPSDCIAAIESAYNRAYQIREQCEQEQPQNYYCIASGEIENA